MLIKRIIPNISAGDLAKARQFYGDILGLETVMDLGWIITFASPEEMTPQVSVAIEGGSGTAVPDLSIEVDDLDERWTACRLPISLSNTVPLLKNGVCDAFMFATHSETS